MLSHLVAIEALEERVDECRHCGRDRLRHERAREADDGLRDVVGPVPATGVRPVDHLRTARAHQHVLGMNFEVHHRVTRADRAEPLGCGDRM